ncbi:hypothetical protein C1646_758904 [Rhizophagus diaphanus]|nr:hypothetical protein C1646_758904 [Rhizophagus diaphanus] [Rhizophagus sp. MUCL 43196]
MSSMKQRTSVYIEFKKLEDQVKIDLNELQLKTERCNVKLDKLVRRTLDKREHEDIFAQYDISKEKELAVDAAKPLKKL